MTVLTKQLAYQGIQEFFNQKPFIMFATGTSCAVDLGFGMPALECHLKDFIPSYDLSSAQKAEWDLVIEQLADSGDFESSMNSINDAALLSHVVNETAKLVGRVQGNNLAKLIANPFNWTALEIISRLAANLPHADPVLHMATPNYDLLAEFALSASQIPYSTGFLGGIIRKLNWNQSLRQMTFAESVVQRNRRQMITRYHNHIKLYKVHGSLNVYCKDREVIECDIWQEPPVGYERLLITPGTAKHEKLHDYRDTLLGEYDAAVRSHNHFLFLGFGFNDTQLVNNAIGDKLVKECSAGLIITRDSNSRIEELVSKAKNTWLVCKSKHDNSTRIYNSQFSDWLHIEDKELWRFEKFAQEIMGQ
ncbi:SIR2 family protein [Thalassomonas viridans]|uniref:SIR2 family protein n=1 Tax=Thalassomonas viridans TaxID=137584 RepID=A0AAE9YXB0_9GAMM|nr:SIR2 family protein [Thalassomonas viridans]WDE02916.1 SIR2 family protein [Thalassomonas viridans]